VKHVRGRNRALLAVLWVLVAGCGGGGSGGSGGQPITGSFVIDDSEAHDFRDSLYGVCVFQFRGRSWAGTFDLDLELVTATCSPEVTLEVTGGVIVLWSTDPGDTWSLVLTADSGSCLVTQGDCGRQLAGDFLVDGTVVEQDPTPNPPFNELAGLTGRVRFTFDGTSDASGTAVGGTFSGDLR
jgi:hypothetical protein